jgi:hypothetical protein
LRKVRERKEVRECEEHRLVHNAHEVAAGVQRPYARHQRRITRCTSREKLIPVALKMLIPGEFGFAGDLHAGGNVLSLANLHCAPGIKKITAGEFSLCAEDKSYPWRTRNWFAGDKNSKFQKFKKK